jgi:hypothetical protein
VKYTSMLIAAVASLSCGIATAEETRAQRDTERDTVQQERIEQGLKSGELSSKEAGQLERREAHVEGLESRAERDGKISNAEQARINSVQNRTSRAIYRQKHDAQTGDPDSASSRRMQADVQRNANQQARIAQGLRSGELTNREAAGLEHGQARVNRGEANAAANGRVGAAEQVHLEKMENRQSRRVRREKHD